MCHRRWIYCYKLNTRLQIHRVNRAAISYNKYASRLRRIHSHATIVLDNDSFNKHRAHGIHQPWNTRLDALKNGKKFVFMSSGNKGHFVICMTVSLSDNSVSRCSITSHSISLHVDRNFSVPLNFPRHYSSVVYQFIIPSTQQLSNIKFCRNGNLRNIKLCILWETTWFGYSNWIYTFTQYLMYKTWTVTYFPNANSMWYRQ